MAELNRRSKIKTNIILGIILFCVIYQPGFGQDTTRIQNDTISVNTIWTKTNSPYLVSRDMLVDYGATLTIEPGVLVIFNRGDEDQGLPHVEAIDFEIYGELIAEGTETDPITFKDIYNQKDSVSWKRIGVGHGWEQPAKAFFKYVNFFNCSNVAIWPSSIDTLVIENCYFENCDRVFQDEESTQTNMTIRYNQFENITYEIFSVFTNAGTYAFHYNNFPDKTDHIIKSYGIVDARFNYWGEPATAEMNAGGNPKNISVILDNWDDTGFGTVNYNSWLDAPWPDGKPVFEDTTIVTDGISIPTTWTLANSPYYIPEDLHISAELTIENGVEVIVGPGHFEGENPILVSIFIDEGGEIIVNPDSEQVWFHSLDGEIIPDQIDTTGWFGLNIDANNATVQNLRIENANTGIKANKPNFLISNVHFEKCFAGIFLTDNASGTVQYSTIISQSHRETGIQIGPNEGAGPYKINYNNLYTLTENQYNTNLQLYFYADDVDARYNYWGEIPLAEMSAGGNPKNISVIIDSYDDPSFGTVDYSYWLDAPWPDGKPVYPEDHTRDSLALVALYNNTNGVNWNNNTNWLSGPLSTWFGITMENERVTEVSLGDNNNLTGPLPAAMGNLDSLAALQLNSNNLTGAVPSGFQGLSNLKNIDLADNHFTDLPDLSSLSISDLNVQNNKLTFEDIEPNVGIPNFIYAPQDSIGEVLDTTLLVGDSLKITIIVGGSENHYKWYRNGLAAGDTSTTLEINPVLPENDGDVYFLEITNSVAPGLTLYSNRVIIEAVGEPATVSDEGTVNLAVTTTGLSATVNPNYLDTNVSFEYGLTSSYGNIITAEENPVSGNLPVPVSASLTGLTENTIYHFRVTATNAAGSVTGSDQIFTTKEYPASFTPPAITDLPVRSVPGDYDITDYRMVGIPGEPDIPLSDILTGDFEKHWIAYWDNGTISSNSADYYVRYDGSNIFNFTRGRAFWIISMNEITFGQMVPTVDLNANDEITIPLHEGWNIITNPFLENVSWDAVQDRNGISYTLFGYNSSGRFTASTLVPYQGYHVQNSGGLTELIIPYPGKVSSMGKDLETNWKVSLRIKGRILDENIIHFGIAPAAKIDLDQTEYNIPRLFRETKGAWLDRPEWDKLQSRFASDYRPELGTIQVWPISSYLPENEEIILHFNGIEDIPAEYSVVLIDSLAMRSVNLRSGSAYNLISPVKERQFQFVVGKPDAVEMKIKEVLPQEFNLEQNFPNPFNSTTIIPIILADNRFTELIVYNVLGKRIKILHRGELSAGRHLIEWNGENSRGGKVPTGIYFVRMVAGENIFSRKLILLK